MNFQSMNISYDMSEGCIIHIHSKRLKIVGSSIVGEVTHRTVQVMFIFCPLLQSRGIKWNMCINQCPHARTHTKAYTVYTGN